MNTVAFIPARGGSERLKNKNLLDFNGKPLLYYAIAYAQKCGIDKIVVSTDDQEISSVALKYGAEVIIRPDNLSGNMATTASAAQYTLEEIEKKGYKCDAFITLQPTNPLRTVNLMNDCLRIYNEGELDSVITVSKNDKKLGSIENGYYQALNYNTGQRSQDLDKSYYENGLIYISKPDLILEGDIFGERIKTVEVNDLKLLIDIDYTEEFEIAEFLYNRYSDIFGY